MHDGLCAPKVVRDDLVSEIAPSLVVLRKSPLKVAQSNNNNNNNTPSLPASKKDAGPSSCLLSFKKE
jgi:hypothetical protein